MSQNQAIKNHLQKGKSLTPLQALDKFNCWALSSRISNLRAEGLNVKVEYIIKGGKHFAKYYL